MSEIDRVPPWRVLGKVQAIPGYAYGLSYPGLVVSLEGRSLESAERQRLGVWFEERCPGLDQPAANQGPGADTPAWRPTVQWLMTLWQRMLHARGLPVHEAGRVLALNTHRARCLIPTLEGSQRALAQVIQASLDCLNLWRESVDSLAQEERLKKALAALARFSPSGSNVPRFIRAAHELGIPFRALPGGVYQYGLGRHARWLDSSFTDNTPTISAKLARSKVWASALLRQCGIPVPRHEVVIDAQGAVRAAQRLGYPVVVKPADLDGGVGVASDLRCDDEVREAFHNARKLSRNILVEEHVQGRDYRLTVFNGALIWAIERVPAGVTGDGHRTVVELIEQTNADPRRGVGQHAPLKRLVMDAESSSLLAQQGLSLTSVPAHGCFVRLRRAANVASGGTPQAVFDRVHPDNAQLAIRAAEALRLDLAGIDLLIEDVAVSWRDSGAAICEVNGQPNLGQTTAAHLYAQLLKQLVPGTGRVPTIYVFGAQNSADWLRALEAQLQGKGLAVGVASSEEVRVAGEVIHCGEVTPHAGGRILALNRRVDAMVVAIGEDSILRTGLPVARCDVLVLAGTNIRVQEPRVQADGGLGLRELLKCLLPACDGQVIVRADQKDFVSARDFLGAAHWFEVSGNDAQFIQTTVRKIEEQILKEKA